MNAMIRIAGALLELIVAAVSIAIASLSRRGARAKG